MNNYHKDIQNSITLTTYEDGFIDFTKLNQDQLTSWLITACKNNDLPLVRYLLTSKDLLTHADVHGYYCKIMQEYNEEPLRSATECCSKELIDYLCTSEELVEHADILHHNDEILYALAKSQKMELIEYLMNAIEVEERPDISYHFLGFLCHQKSCLPILKKFLSNKSYQHHVDISYLVSFACSYGNIEAANYLLFSPELENDNVLTDKHIFKALEHNKIELVDYLLNDSILQEKYPFLKEYMQNRLEMIKTCLVEKTMLPSRSIKMPYESLLINSRNIPALNYLLSIAKTEIEEMICTYAKEDLIDYIIHELHIEYNDNIKVLHMPTNLKSAFEMRELNKNLEKKLPNNLDKISKSKL